MLTPVEIRHVKLGRRLVGYDRKAADRLLSDIVASFEDVWRERADLREEIERLEGELARYKEGESLLRNTLLAAERAGDELKAQARREAELIVQEAHAEARAAKGEIRRLQNLATGMRADYRAFLHAALERLEDEQKHRHAADEAA